MTFRDCLYLVFTVTVECCPLDIGGACTSPVKAYFLFIVTD